MLTIRNLHPWDLAPAEAIALQKRLGREVLETPLAAPERVRYIAGIDVSSVRESALLTAGVVVWDSVKNEVKETAAVQMERDYPYVPGLLSFRELPVVIEALKKLTMEPDVLFVDGQGRAHPRRLGIAAHLGLLLDRPTVGVGKSRLVGHYEEPGPLRGDQSPLMDGSEQIGTVLRTKERSNPLFISVGSHIDLASAVSLVLSSLRGYRLPEPTRLAHLHVNGVRTAGVGVPLPLG
jgi:deoxyribonuclease V